MSDHSYLKAQLDVLDAVSQGLKALRLIALDPDGNANTYDYAFAEFYSGLSDFAEFSISTAGFSGLNDTRSESFLYNLCERTAAIFKAPCARLCLGGTSQSMLMLLGKILPEWVKEPRRTIVLTDVQCHQSVLGGVDIGRWDMCKLSRDYNPKLGVSAPLTLETVRLAAKAIGAEKIAALVYNPVSYDGFRNCEQERKIYNFCQKHGIKVLCDFAWSPAYSLYPSDNQNVSLLDNCDSCASSPHKKGLFPSSVSILLFKDKTMASHVIEAGRLGWFTTSPSYGLLQLVDFRLVQMEMGLITTALADVVEVSQNLRAAFDDLSPYLYCVQPRDVGADYQEPSHILLSSQNSGLDCRVLSAWLSKHAHTDWEKASKQTGLFLVSQRHKLLQSRIIDDLERALSTALF